MVSIKRNTKGELQEAVGIRSKQSSMYSPNLNTAFKTIRNSAIHSTINQRLLFPTPYLTGFFISKCF